MGGGGHLLSHLPHNKKRYIFNRIVVGKWSRALRLDQRVPIRIMVTDALIIGAKQASEARCAAARAHVVAGGRRVFGKLMLIVYFFKLKNTAIRRNLTKKSWITLQWRSGYDKRMMKACRFPRTMELFNGEQLFLKTLHKGCSDDGS
ncbi:hypothetical protein EVAR_50906_1 [Eumeta japonica]|uniref:Uncharacterized protein n=1 Tax=Eumeta variegata TaxID=151549 RepID=A0A4C1YCA6_EUMVA|nr:hypothetical protein EVAR_50906_1 [Eumeta japonica]